MESVYAPAWDFGVKGGKKRRNTDGRTKKK